MHTPTPFSKLWVTYHCNTIREASNSYSESSLGKPKDLDFSNYFNRNHFKLILRVNKMFVVSLPVTASAKGNNRL